MTQAATLVELGSGSSEKTRLLLDALRAERSLRRFMPFDVCLPAVRQRRHGAAARLSGRRRARRGGRLPRARAFSARAAPGGGPLLVAFLGSTIGNFDEAERARFFAALRLVLRPGDWFLLGADLVKSKRRLDAAYNDAAGVTVHVQQERAAGAQPRSARVVRRGDVRPRRRLRSRARAGRHPPARARRARGEGARARADGAGSPPARRCAPRSA